ncbi:MAG: MarR family winged helix-turn-helix transcriptional regulator [Chloroflexota bacterium]|jgi:DNA-binding MarR family transcriptional regulator|nr:MarR family winged helix-turn-helix transcriptional regulator [Chloroflexota bacterium]MDH5243126.1 MarR family winged helix-turn-helix transcriptional regulator [Chloroflexota bacterium]
MTTRLPDAPAPGTDPTAIDPVATDLERIAVGAVGLTTRALAETDAGFELTLSQWRALLVLGERPDGARIGEVAGRVGVTLPATSRLLRRLERRGLTTLAVDEQDRRATRARLTDHGDAVRSAILARRRSVLREVARAIPERDRESMAAGLRAIATELERFA